MALRQILTEPNKTLREKSLPVEIVDDDLRKLMDDMLETMYAAPGIGLAAIQIGVPKRVIVLDIDQKEGQKNPLFFINPEIVKKFAEIERPESCQIKYLDYNGEKKEIEAKGMLATCIQHEMDHLEGVLFIDYLSNLKKSMIIKKLSKQKKSVERIVV